MIIDLDSKTFGIEGKESKVIPPEEITAEVIDPLSGRSNKGKYSFIFFVGGIEGGSILLSYNGKTISIEMNPVVGSIVVETW